MSNPSSSSSPRIRIGAAALLAASILSWVNAEDVVSVVGLVHEAREAVGANRTTNALALTERALELDPAYGEAWKQQGRVWMLLHRPEEALQTLAAAQLLLPGDADVARWQQHTLVDLGRYRELASHIAQWSDAEVAALDRGLVARLLGTLLDDNDGPAAAQLAARWSSVITNETDSAAAQALVQLAASDPEAAARHLARIKPAGKQINPMAALAFDRWGVALMAQHEPERAIEAFTTSLTHRPDGLNALRDLGWALKETGQPEKAIATWQRGIALSPSVMEWSAWVADTQLQLGQAAKAEQSANDLLAAVPGHEQARVLKLAALLIQNSPDAASFEEEVRSGLNGRRLVVLARVRADRHNGAHPAAAERLEAYLATAPADPVIRSTLLEVYREWAARVSRKDSIPPLERMLALDPTHAGAQRDLGWAWWTLGDHEKGLALLDQAIRHQVGNRDEVIVQVYSALVEDGQRERATELLKSWAPGPPWRTWAAACLPRVAWSRQNPRSSWPGSPGPTPRTPGTWGCCWPSPMPSKGNAKTGPPILILARSLRWTCWSPTSSTCFMKY
jgi:tetratricopeptide (TPR) repeat protein